jgi:L-lactate dehydrogenase complex protein LldF
MHIPLPRMLRAWREKEFERHLTPKRARWGLAVHTALASRPKLYRWATRAAAWGLKIWGGRRGSMDHLPYAQEWTDSRTMAAPQYGRTFMDLYQGRPGARSDRT